MKLAAVLWLTSALLAQPQSGSIHGVVRDALTGTPISGAIVRAGKLSTRTDSAGGFRFDSLPAGDVKLDISGDAKALGPKSVTLAPGQDLSVDIVVQGIGRISGTVLDADGKPLGDALVFLVTREYSMGAIRYVPWGGSLTDSRGQFGRTLLSQSTAGVDMAAVAAANRALAGRLNRPDISQLGPGVGLDSGRAYLLAASKGRAALAKPGMIDQEPADREPVPGVTWYIGSYTPEGALPLTLSPGEQRQGLNVRMINRANYCIRGTIRAGTVPGGSVQVLLQDTVGASQGILGHVMLTQPLSKDPALDTTLDICNLSPGDYRINSAFFPTDKSNMFPLAFRTQVVTIMDKDAKVSLDGLPPVSLSGEIVWAGDPPKDQDAAATISMRLRPLNHGAHDESGSLKANVPGPFSFDRLLMDEYELVVTSVPAGSYLKDITFAGRSIRGLVQGGVTNGLRVILGRDGAHITAQVSDEKGRPLADTWVVAMPAGSSSEAELADGMVWGRTSAAGTWTSPLLAPGKYLVLATSSPVDRSVEAVDRLYRARGKAQEVDLAPGADLTVKLK